MKTIEYHCKNMKINKITKFLWKKNENHENLRISLENNENHENPKIQCDNDWNHENHKIIMR